MRHLQRPTAPCRTRPSQSALEQQCRLTTEQWMDADSAGRTYWRKMSIWSVCQWLACWQQQLQLWRPCGKLRSAGTALCAIFRSPVQSRADPWLGATADRLDTAGFWSTVIVNACLLNWWKKSTPKQVQHFQEAEWEDDHGNNLSPAWYTVSGLNTTGPFTEQDWASTLGQETDNKRS